MDFFNDIAKNIGYAADQAGKAVGEASKVVSEKVDSTALGAVATGGAAGAGISAIVGGMGLAVGGTAIAIGMAPVAIAGAVVGLGAYGVSKALNSSDEPIPPPPLPPQPDAIKLSEALLGKIAVALLSHGIEPTSKNIRAYLIRQQSADTSHNHLWHPALDLLNSYPLRETFKSNC